MIHPYLAPFIVEKPKPDDQWPNWGPGTEARTVALSFEDRDAALAALAEAGVDFGDEPMPQSFAWDGIGEVSIVGQVVETEAVFDGDEEVSPPTFYPGFYVNILPPEVEEVAPEPGGPMPPETPLSKYIDGAAFLARVTDEEYAAVLTAAQSSPQLSRWVDILRMRGVIDVKGNTALAAKAGLVSLGLLTQERADEIFA